MLMQSRNQFRCVLLSLAIRFSFFFLLVHFMLRRKQANKYIWTIPLKNPGFCFSVITPQGKFGINIFQQLESH